jgi:hypothetical protein
MNLHPNPIDAEQLRSCAAAALQCNRRDLSIRRWEIGPGRRSACAWGQVFDKPFFSKTLLKDPFPVMLPVVAPWEEDFGSVLRSPAEQIETEWHTNLRLFRIAGPESVPTPLGKSIAHRTIVWEDVGGVRVDELFKRHLLLDSQTPAVTAALTRAGEWLRHLQQRSGGGFATLNLQDVVEQMRARLALGGSDSTRRVHHALQILQEAFAEIPSSELTVRTVLGHGDFTLANMRWNAAKERLYVVDFENFAPAHECQDLLSLIFEMRTRLLNPLVSKRSVMALENAFWSGYGPASRPIMSFIHGIASARILYFHLPQALQKRKQQGGISRATASVYSRFLAPAMLARCMEGM